MRHDCRFDMLRNLSQKSRYFSKIRMFVDDLGKQNA